MNILLVRHGETDYNAQGRMYGHAQVNLNARGLTQARAVAKRLSAVPVARIYSSDLVRAVQTAAEIAALQQVSVHYDAGLREQHVGDWEHLTIPEVVERYPQHYAAHSADPAHTPYSNGESFAMLQQRAYASLNAIIAAHQNGETICVVCHGGTINAIVCAVLELDIAHHRKLWIDNCSLTTVRISADQRHLIGLNDHAHLVDMGTHP